MLKTWFNTTAPAASALQAVSSREPSFTTRISASGTALRILSITVAMPSASLKAGTSTKVSAILSPGHPALQPAGTSRVQKPEYLLLLHILVIITHGGADKAKIVIRHPK